MSRLRLSYLYPRYIRVATIKLTGNGTSILEFANYIAFTIIQIRIAVGVGGVVVRRRSAVGRAIVLVRLPLSSVIINFERHRGLSVNSVNCPVAS